MIIKRSTEQSLVGVLWGVVAGVAAVRWHFLILLLLVLLVAMCVLRVEDEDES